MERLKRKRRWGFFSAKDGLGRNDGFTGVWRLWDEIWCLEDGEYTNELESLRGHLNQLDSNLIDRLRMYLDANKSRTVGK
jgi:hypothetical protein